MIGVGVKSSTSDLLMSNCDEFIFYDDLVLKQQPALRRRRSEPGTRVPASAKPSVISKAPDDRAQAAVDLVRETIEALYAERGDTAKHWGSMVKHAPAFIEEQSADAKVAIATTGMDRLKALPDITTFGEQDIPGLEIYAWWAVLALPLRLQT